jgi:hypothetical protein
MRDDSNATEYRVAYHFFAIYFWPNQLTYRMRNVPWEKPVVQLSGYRRLDPPGFMPFKNLGEIAVLPDIEVKFVPFIRAGIRAVAAGAKISRSR